jgi:hypothetical protein
MHYGSKINIYTGFLRAENVSSVCLGNRKFCLGRNAGSAINNPAPGGEVFDLLFDYAQAPPGLRSRRSPVVASSSTPQAAGNSTRQRRLKYK